MFNKKQFRVFLNDLIALIDVPSILADLVQINDDEFLFH